MLCLCSVVSLLSCYHFGRIWASEVGPIVSFEKEGRSQTQDRDLKKENTREKPATGEHLVVKRACGAGSFVRTGSERKGKKQLPNTKETEDSSQLLQRVPKKGGQHRICV